MTIWILLNSVVNKLRSLAEFAYLFHVCNICMQFQICLTIYLWSGTRFPQPELSHFWESEIAWIPLQKY